MKVLCVEDNATQRKMVDLMLAATGIDVDFAADGQEALEAYQTTEYDAVLMDMEMPGMSGLQATREIRLVEDGFHLGYTPILFLSANESADRIDMGYQMGGDGHLNKPFTSSALINALDSVMRAVKRRGLDLRQAI
ncbi:response regulator [Asticcacaulis taihuensis]|uniref:response regulator n=1 Tax=Asticcacaulis taihuensis TaxID=260084 RepID=UPI003F7B5458